jgi:hypothetical protein
VSYNVSSSASVFSFLIRLFFFIPYLTVSVCASVRLPSVSACVLFFIALILFGCSVSISGYVWLCVHQFLLDSNNECTALLLIDCIPLFFYNRNLHNFSLNCVKDIVYVIRIISPRRQSVRSLSIVRLTALHEIA